jgi:hypothetical protein
MKTRPFLLCLGATCGVMLAGLSAAGADRPAAAKEALRLTTSQKEFLRLEPILATVSLEGAGGKGLPGAPGEGKLGTLRFDVAPAVKPRPNARPLPLEGLNPDPGAASRLFDLSEWFQFPEAGSWTVRAVFERDGRTLTSGPLTFTIRKPDKNDPEFPAMSRIHHVPWSNYEADAFCGDTFDVVQKWPGSRFARYCHYWNGRHLQRKGQYDKAIASYRTVVERYPDFALAEAADYGIGECLVAQKKVAEARKHNADLQRRYGERGAKARLTGPTTVQRLAEGLSQRLRREVPQD